MDHIGIDVHKKESQIERRVRTTLRSLVEGGSGRAGAFCSRPQQNGKVGRSHRIDQEEFWGRQRLQDFEVAAAALRNRETRYSDERFSLALQGRTPAEKLAAFQPPLRVA